MKISKLQKPQIFVEIPLTTQSGKVRIKARNSFYEYGLPVATRQIPFSQKHYVEWQIGYDADKSDNEKLNLTSLKESDFKCAYLTLDEKDKDFVFEAFKIFGILSPNHNHDIRRIVEWIRANLHYHQRT